MSSMSHNNGVMTRFWGQLVFGSQKSPLDEGDVDGLKFIPPPKMPLHTLQNICYYKTLCHFGDPWLHG